MSSTQVKILVPGNHLMVGLLGQRDELLRLVEGAFGGARILVRGNEITVEGEDAERVGRLFEEWRPEQVCAPTLLVAAATPAAAVVRHGMLCCSAAARM